MTRHIIVASIGILFFTTGCNGISDTYLDCLARGGKSAEPNDDEHKRACMKKFQQKLPVSVSDNIKGESSFYDVLKLVSGTIHNRSPDWLITEVTIGLYPDGLLGEKHMFRSEVDAEPLSSSRFEVYFYSGITRGDDYIWNIEDAYGIKSR